MERDSEIERAQDMLMDLGDDLVYDGPLTSPDAYFILRLFEEYYKAESEEKLGSKAACNFAWALARDVANYVDEEPEFDWLNAYFVVSGMMNVPRQALIREADDATESLDWDGSEDPSHFEKVTADDRGETAETLAAAINDIVDLVEMYVDLDEPSDEPLEKRWRLASTFGTFQCRYAHGLHYEMREGSIGMKLIDETLSKYKDGPDALSNRELLRGGRMVEEWLEHRAKQVHHAFRTTGRSDD